MENILQLRSSPADRIDPYSLLSKISKLEKFITDHFKRSNLKRVRLDTQEMIHFIDAATITRCESMGNYCKVFVTGQTAILISKPLKYMISMLPQEHFLKTHQSHLINSRSILKVHKKGGLKIELEDGTSIPVSRSEKANVLNHLHNL